MHFDTLNEFIELGNCLSFSKAAQKLYVSQPTLSGHITELEKTIGAKLVTRERPVRLTAAGRLFYQNANTLVELYSETVEACRGLEASNETGSLTIKMAYAFETIKTPMRKLIASFRKEHPSIDVTVISGETGNLLDDLNLGRINCGFFSTSFDERVEQFKEEAQVETVPMHQAPLGLWMRRENPLALKDKVSIYDLEGRDYPMPSGERFSELTMAAQEILDAYNVKPHCRNEYVDTFMDYLYGVRENDVFLGVVYPNEEKEFELVSRRFNPELVHSNYFIIKIEETNPATELFYDYVKQNAPLLVIDDQASHWTA